MHPRWFEGFAVTTKPVGWEGVALFTAQWVSGTQATNYYGPITVELWTPDVVESEREAAWVDAEARLFEKLREKAEKLGANAVVGLDVTINPFATNEVTLVPGLLFKATGTAAKLEMIS